MFSRGPRAWGSERFPVPYHGPASRLFSAPMSSPSPRRINQAITLQQAAQEAPTLASLAALARESGQRLEALKSLMPAPMHSAVQPGPIDGDSWCLLVSSNAVAAKLRQLLPAFQAHLRSRGWNVRSIRLKVQGARP